ncbi:hypothetical protein [Listeria costaricensis]|uniref:hypothetical protein n=1 Tax=Listeria costaricensis TaxID=2026604 RepID=UPI000C082450|nr:hypothetical protein [Listeria costaricensis]
MSAEDAARYSKFWDDVYEGKTVNQRMGVDDIQLNRVGKQEYEFSSYDPDPAKAVNGPGKESHPKEWNETINNLEKDGVEIISKDSNGSIAYAPKSDFRNPQMIISDDVSYSALMHEQQHYLDDMENGFPGPAFSYQTLNRWKSEFNAYMREIKIAEKAGNNKLAGQLYENYIRERKQLLGY